MIIKIACIFMSVSSSISPLVLLHFLRESQIVVTVYLNWEKEYYTATNSTT